MACTRAKSKQDKQSDSASLVTCRVCMKKMKIKCMKELFRPDCKIVENIQFCTGILLTENHNLSSFICQNCESHLNIAHQFKTTCIASEEALLAQLEGIKIEVKMEILDMSIFEQDIVSTKNCDNLSIKKCDQVSIRQCNNVAITECDDLSIKKSDNTSIKEYDDLSIKKCKNTSINECEDVSIKDCDNMSIKDCDNMSIKEENEYVYDDDDDLEDFKDVMQVIIKKRPGKNKVKPKTKHQEKSEKETLNSQKETKKATPTAVFKRLQCGVCDLRFKTREESFEHHVDVHNGTKWICEVCGKQFMYPSSHHAHMRIHRGVEYKCAHAHCTYTTVNKSDLSKHQRIHTGEKNFHCHICPNAFRNSTNLHTHIRHQHGGEKRFPCDRCDKRFHSNHRLRRHLDSHNNIKRHECPVCHSCFTRRCHWKKHLLKQHSVTIPPAKPGRRRPALLIQTEKSIFDKSTNVTNVNKSI